MKHTPRLLAIVAAGAVTAGALAGCSTDGTPSGDGTDAAPQPVSLDLVWWGNDTRATMYNEVIELFQDEYPHITVNGSFADFPSYWDMRSTQAAARDLPDVMQFDQANLVQYGGNGALLDVTPYLGETIDISGMEDVVIDAATVDGTQYGVPVATGTLGLFVNPAVVEAAGVEPLDADYTWDDLNSWITDISASGAVAENGKPLFGGYDQGLTMWFFFQWLLQQDREPFDADGEFAFTQDDIVDYLDSTSAVRAAGAYFPPARGNEIAPAEGFGIGESASSFTWDSFFSRYTDIENLQTLPVPTGPDGEKAIFYTVLHMAGSANTEHPEETALLLDFLANDPEVAQIFGTSRGVPASTTQVEALDFPEDSLEAKSLAYRASLEGYETVNTPILPASFASLEATWIRLNEDLMYGLITPEQFAEQWWAEAEAIG